MAISETVAIEETGKGLNWVWKNLIKPKLLKGKLERKEMMEGIRYTKSTVSRLESGMEKINTQVAELSETQYSFMNLQNIAFFKSNGEGKWVYVSPAACQLLGRAEGELMGNNWISWVAKEKDRIFAAWEFSEENKSSFDEFVVFRKPNGELVTVHTLAFHKKNTMGTYTSLGKLSFKTITKKT